MYLLIALLAVALYAVTLAGTFVYDDMAVVVEDKRIADPQRWGEYWTDSYNFGVDNLYRPLVSMSYAIERFVHGPIAWPFHLVNVLLHAAASLMVAWFAATLARRLSVAKADAVGVISSVLFAAHPVHVEAVANVVGRAELLCAIATLGAIGLALSPLTARRVIAIWLCCVVAILCKEQGILAALMVGVVRHTGGRQSPGGTGGTAEASRSGALQRKLAATLFALLTANIAVIVYLRENVLHLKFWWERSFLDPWIQPLADSIGSDRWLAPLTITGRYLGLLVAPVTLRIDYGGQIVPGVVHLNDPYFWLGVVAILLFTALAAFAWRTRDRLIGINLALFAIAYALVSNWPTIIGVNVAERLMYLPSAFFVIIVAALVVRLPRRAIVPLVTLIVVLFSLRTVTYAWRWNDRLRLYEYAVHTDPRAMKATLLTMQEFTERGDLANAEHYARHATEIDPTYDEAWLRLAGVLIEREDFIGAEAAIEKSKAIRMTGKVGAYVNKLEERRASSLKPSSR